MASTLPNPSISSKPREMDKFYNLVRNLFCGSLALAVIASGRARRAKERILNGNSVTSIYFHNPNKRLYAQCVRWLSRNGYTFISVHELIRILREGKEPPKGAVWLSFDDGFKELLENVIPLSHQRKLPITVFIPSGIVEGAGLFPWLPVVPGVRQSMTKEEVEKIAAYPEVTLGSHTVGHVETLHSTDEQIRFELTESKRALESWTGRAVTSFAYPAGRVSGEEAPLLAACGYELAATTVATLVPPGTDPYFVPRFNVGDNISFPEAICNMVGVWRPAIDPVLHLVRSAKAISHLLRRALYGQRRVSGGTSA